MHYENNLTVNLKPFPICQQLENSSSVLSTATNTMQNNGETIDANKKVRCQYVSHTRLQCYNLVNPVESDAFHGFCSSHNGYIHRRQKLFLKVQNVFDPGFKEELVNPDSNAFGLSDDEDETLIPQIKWPNFEENMYCDDELNDDDDNPLRNAEVYTQKEAIREYIFSLQRQIDGIQEFRGLLSEKYRRLQRRIAKLRKSKRKHAQFPAEKLALFHAVRKYRNTGSRFYRYQRHYAEKSLQLEESSINDNLINKESEPANDDQIIASIVNDLVHQVDMSQSRASSHTTEIEVVTKAKSAVGKPKKLSKSSKYQVEKYYIDGILQKDKLPPHILEILEKFEESTIDERNLLNARQTEVLEQMQSPSVVPTTHPNASSTTSGFEALLPTIPRPTALEETLSDEEELLGEISPTTSNKVPPTSMSVIPTGSQYSARPVRKPAIQMTAYKPYQPLPRLYSQQPVRMHHPTTNARMDILKPSRAILSKLPSSYQKPITTIEPLFADLDEFSDDQLFDEEYDYEDVDVDHEMYMFESPLPPIPAMQIRSTPVSVPVPTPTSVQQHASRPPGRPPLAATFTCARARPYKPVSVSGPCHGDYDSRYAIQVQDQHFVGNFGPPRQFSGSTNQNPIFQNQRRFVPVMTYQPTTAITVNTGSANPMSVGHQQQFVGRVQQQQQRSSLMTTQRQYQPTIVKRSAVRPTLARPQLAPHTDLAISSLSSSTVVPSKSNARTKPSANKPSSQQQYLEYLKRQKIAPPPPSKSSGNNGNGGNDGKEQQQQDKVTGPSRASSICSIRSQSSLPSSVSIQHRSSNNKTSLPPSTPTSTSHVGAFKSSQKQSRSEESTAQKQESSLAQPRESKGEAQYESNGGDQTDQPVVVVVSDEEKNSKEPETTRRVTRSSVAAVLSASKLGKQVQVQARLSTTKETPKSSLGMQRRSSSISMGKLRDYRESTTESQTLDSRTTTNTTPSLSGDDNDNPVKRGRGRPPKNVSTTPSLSGDDHEDNDGTNPVKRGRGRPRKDTYT